MEHLVIYGIYDLASSSPTLANALAPQDGLAVGYKTLATVTSPLPCPNAIVWTGAMPDSPIWSANQGEPVNGVQELGTPTYTAAQLTVYQAIVTCANGGTAATAKQMCEAILTIAQLARPDIFPTWP